MSNDGVWEVDRVAAADLLAALEAVPEPEWGVIVAQALARNRRQSYDWASQRARQSALQVLEKEAAETFQRHNGEWIDGFRHAEKCLMTTTPSALLALPANQARSKGQILRSLVRSARRTRGTTAG